MYLKLLFADYDDGYAIIEFIGEWNDAIENDIMVLKRDFIDSLIHEGITKFILIGENVLNFHASDDSYYEEWIEDIEDGWVAMVNFHDHVSREMNSANIDHYFSFWRSARRCVEWRTFQPHQVFDLFQKLLKQLN
ncbi:MAG: hypothetical protein R2779_07910 [Crocinitomicaceae bacterium]